MQITFDIPGTPEIHLDVLKAICGDASNLSMLDLGCGFAPQTRQLGFRSRTYVDVVERDLAEEMPYFINCNILSNEYFKKEPYDICLALDVIEHFQKDTADYLLYLMGRQSHKQIIFTPLGDYLIGFGDPNSPDTHRSGWQPEELDAKGWEVISFPRFHTTLNLGAFFAYKCENIEEEAIRILDELTNKEWTK
jgi:hypothetical protein